MPISDEALHNPKNRFIAVTGNAKLGQAVAALTTLGGQPWWHVVVRMDDGSWRVARFSELNESVADTEDAAEMVLRDAKQLRVAATVEHGSVETNAAQALARKSPTHVLVVTDNGMPVGILVEGVTRGAVTPSPGTGGPVMPSASLNELGGKYITLKDYGSILLGASVGELGGKPVNLGPYGDILLRPGKK